MKGLYRKMTPEELVLRGGVTHGVTHSGQRGSGMAPHEPGDSPAKQQATPRADARKGDRHKLGQAAYMRAYRARKKAAAK